MADQNNQQQTNQPAPQQEPTKTPEEILIEMKKNMVPKAKAEEWKDKYNALFQSVANGSFSGEDKEPKMPGEEEKYKAYTDNLLALADTSKSMPPLEMFRRMLEVDDYRTSHGERSGFAPSNGEYTEDIQRSCEKTHALLEAVISQSEGDNGVALAYLGAHLTDPAGLAALSRAR